MTLPVEVIRSKKRRKTVEAELRGGVVKLHVPGAHDQAEIDEYAADLVPRLERKFRSDHIDLEQRAVVLGRRYQLPTPRSIVWTDNQRKQWGSCDTVTRDIRISARLAAFPPWVLDYVIVHELAHLLVADHSPTFNALVERYPRAERARGYLLAKQDDPFGGERSDLGADRPSRRRGGRGGLGRRRPAARCSAPRDQASSPRVTFDLGL